MEFVRKKLKGLLDFGQRGYESRVMEKRRFVVPWFAKEEEGDKQEIVVVVLGANFDVIKSNRLV